MTNIQELYKRLEKTLVENPAMVDKIHETLSIGAASVHAKLPDSDGEINFKFFVPETAVMDLFKQLHLDSYDVNKTFHADWHYETDSPMYSDPYFQILLLLIAFGMRNRDGLLAEHAQFLLLIKVWNNRKIKDLKGCNTKGLAYVIERMKKNLYMAHLYDTPYKLLKDYFVPRLLEKHANQLRDEHPWIKMLFMQSCALIHQLYFYRDKATRYGESLDFLPQFMRKPSKRKVILRLNLVSIEEVCKKNKSEKRLLQAVA